jgi:tetratricopeptide (TPR) repeat protein
MGFSPFEVISLLAGKSCFDSLAVTLMNQQLITRICVVLLAAIVGLLLYRWIMQASDGMKLVGFILLGGGGGILAVKYLLPWIGDAIGESMYSSGEQLEQDGLMKAAACISQGDFEGALAHYQAMIEEKPEDPFPAAEMAKVHAERLGDPQTAIQVLTNHLQRREWSVDDGAFLLFRVVEVQTNHLHDFAAARATLEKVIASYPNTRHSANAHHKITELDQAEFKFLQEQRAKAAKSI